MEKLKEYIEFKKLSMSEAADKIGCSRQYLYAIIDGATVGKKTAKKIEKWSKGFLSASELMGL